MLVAELDPALLPMPEVNAADGAAAVLVPAAEPTLAAVLDPIAVPLPVPAPAPMPISELENPVTVAAPLLLPTA